ncbi:MAG: TIGR00730 family Rossman fold protein [Acidimicrobiales bacterium]
MPLRSVCVFCASNLGRSDVFADAARRLGTELARRDITLVYGGASVGLMGVLADTVLDGGGEVVGVITEPLVAREIAHGGLTELLVVDTMARRKATMAARSDAFVMLPGGYGTLDEFFEMVTWAQLHLHDKPCGILDVDDYFDGLLTFLARGVDEQLLRAEHRAMLVVDTEPAALLDRLADADPTPAGKWFEPPGSARPPA